MGKHSGFTSSMHRTAHLPDSVSCWFEATYPAKRGWDANTSSNVCPNTQDGATPSYEGPLPTRRATWSLLKVMWV